MKKLIIAIGALVILSSYKTNDICHDEFVRGYKKGIKEGTQIGIDEMNKALEEKLKHYTLVPK